MKHEMQSRIDKVENETGMKFLSKTEMTEFESWKNVKRDKITIDMLKMGFDKYTVPRQFSMTIDKTKYQMKATMDYSNATLLDVLHHCNRQCINDYRNMVRQLERPIDYIKQHPEPTINIVAAGRKAIVPPTAQQFAEGKTPEQIQADIDMLLKLKSGMGAK